jgi:hypothetical protein
MTWTCGWSDTAFTTTTPAEEAEAIRNELSAAGRPYAASNMLTPWTFAGVSVTQILETGPSIGAFLSGITGTAATPSIPPNCAVLFRKTTAAGGRRNRGRFYAPPCNINEAAVSDAGVIDSSIAAAQQTKWDAALTALSTAGLTPVLFHSEGPFTPTPITGFVLQLLLATQRRRLR